jgi:hypothetical protein
MVNRWALMVAAVLGCGDGIDADLDHLVSSETDGAVPVINSVTTDDGFRQIRQDSLSHLVILGNHLDTTTSITVGTLPTEIESVALHEVRVAFLAPPGLLGRFDVTVVTSGGTATRPEAMRVTPWVVAPDAVAGHGTFQSPMNLCDLELDIAQPGDTVQLLAGAHQCSGFLDLNGGLVIEGAGRDKTFIQGSFVFSIIGSQTTTLRDFAFLAPVLPERLHGNLVVERVMATTRFFVGNGATASFDRYAFEGPGSAVEVQNGSVTITRSRVVRTGTGDAPAISDAPGMNTLSVVSGFAIDDVRDGDTEPLHRLIEASGATLNGATFDGLTVEGPGAAPPYFRVVNGPNGIQF